MHPHKIEDFKVGQLVEVYFLEEEDFNYGIEFGSEGIVTDIIHDLKNSLVEVSLNTQEEKLFFHSTQLIILKEPVEEGDGGVSNA